MLFGNTRDADLTPFPNTHAHYNAYPWIPIQTPLQMSASYHPTRLVFDADLPVAARRCSVHLSLDDTTLVACEMCADLAIRERSKLETTAIKFIRRCRYFVNGSARPLIVASGLKGFHVYFPVIFVSRPMASACDKSLRAMFEADGITYIDPQVSFEHHITGIFSPHRIVSSIRALPVQTAQDYMLRITDPEKALRRGAELLTDFIDRMDFGVHP
jgi:hypothetical protein